MVYADYLVLSEPLPTVHIKNDKGELFLQSDEAGYRPWNSTQLLGKIHVVHHMAS